MKTSLRNLKKTKEMLNSDLRYFKRIPFNKTQLAGVDSDITSWSSNASMHYKKFSAEALVLKALKGLNDRRGSSVVAVKKYIINHYPHVDGKFTLPVIRRILKKALIDGKVMQSQGCDMDGLFKISAEEIRVSQQKEQFRHAKACVKLREQQRLELERRVLEFRAKEEKKRKFLQEREAAKMKRMKESANAAKAAKAKYTADAARAMLGLVKQQPAVAETLITPQNLHNLQNLQTLRMGGAGTSRSFMFKPQIVDYADAAIETAKVVSSEEMKQAIIKAAEYTPARKDFHNIEPMHYTPRSMPIKYERTVRSPILDSLYSGLQSSLLTPIGHTRIATPATTTATYAPEEAPQLTEHYRNQKPITTNAKVNLPSTSKQSVPVAKSGARKRSVTTVKTVRKVAKRPKPKVTKKTVFKITKAA